MNGVFSPIAVGAAVAFCTLATTGQMLADDNSPYGSVRTAHFQNIERSADGEGLGRSEEQIGDFSHVFPYLNYVTLTHEQAFRDDEGILTPLFPASDAIDVGSCLNMNDAEERTENRQPVEHKVTSVVGEPRESSTDVWDERPTTSVQKDSTQAAESENHRGFVAKPMSSIRFAGIAQPVSRTGEPLRAPATSSARSDKPAVVEEHITPEPWRRGHPNRNTFAFRHQPLYFEDPNLERCGTSAGCFTEAVNIVHFAGRIPLMGYLAGSNPPSSCVRALPDCPTCQSFGPHAYVPPPTVDAIAGEIAYIVGIAFLIP